MARIFAFVRIAMALSDSSVNAGNGTHDEAPMKRRYRTNPALITMVIWRTACALHSALAVDEAGVVLAMRSVEWTVEWKLPSRLNPRMNIARSANVMTSDARLQNHWRSAFASAAGAADAHRVSSIARRTSSCQLMSVHLPSMIFRTKSAFARRARRSPSAACRRRAWRAWRRHTSPRRRARSRSRRRADAMRRRRIRRPG